MSKPVLLIYGANGYTGELIAREAVERGLEPILAGRSEEPVTALAGELGLEHRVFSLGDGEAVRRGLRGVGAVLHCAGPFVHTSGPVVEACLATGTHYLDITGEIAVFESLLSRGDEAREAGVALLPGVGFDVVPTDCLAAMLAAELPDASHLTLAFYNDGGSISRGTLKTMIEHMGHGGAIRENGEIVRVPAAWRSRDVPFGCGSRHAMTIPWGDISTAYRTTGIPNIRVYAGAPPATVRRMRRLRPVLPAIGLRPARAIAQWWVGRTVTGPDAKQRRSARVHLWGEVTSETGERRVGTLETPEGYRFTALSAVAATQRVLAGAVAPGAWTPSLAFGAEFVGAIPGVSVGDIEEPVER